MSGRHRFKSKISTIPSQGKKEGWHIIMIVDSNQDKRGGGNFLVWWGYTYHRVDVVSIKFMWKPENQMCFYLVVNAEMFSRKLLEEDTSLMDTWSSSLFSSFFNINSFWILKRGLTRLNIYQIKQICIFIFVGRHQSFYIHFSFQVFHMINLSLFSTFQVNDTD